MGRNRTLYGIDLVLLFMCLLLTSCQSEAVATVSGTALHTCSEVPDTTTRRRAEVPDTIQSIRSDQVDSRPFLDKPSFYESLESLYLDYLPDYEQIKEGACKNVVGGILPHHTVARGFISDYYKAVSKENEYDLIVLISPNHSSIGPRFQVGTKDYYTYEGLVEVDQKVTEALLDSQIVDEVLDKVIEIEHGQLVHMPYIKQYFPTAKVLSIMITETRNNKGIAELVEVMNKALGDKKVLFVASIDFSHYLSLEEATKMDEYTRSLLEASESWRMITLSNDYIDSPSSYMLLMKLLSYQGDYETNVTNHSNSALILHDYNLEETTSYFQVIYNKSP